MALFTTRILLKGNPEESEYDLLYSEMEKRGFARTIESDTGTVYNLPNAEYNLMGSFTRSEVLNLAREAVDTLQNRAAEILVTESKGRSWHNLAKIYD